MKPVARALKAFGLGVWHFVIGDSPEFLAAVMVLVGFALALRHVHEALWIGLPLLVLGALFGSVWHQQRTSGRPPEAKGR